MHRAAQRAHSSAIRRLAAGVAALIIGLLAGCAEAPTAPSTPTAPGLVPGLLEPHSEAYVKQNDPATGCRQDPVWGYGYQVTFTWSAVRGATGYRMHIMHRQAYAALVDEIMQGTRYERRRCTEILGYEQGWQWKVRAVFQDGSEGDWSEVRAINFTRADVEPYQP